MVDADIPSLPTYGLVVGGFTIAVPPPKSAIPRLGWLGPESGGSGEGRLFGMYRCGVRVRDDDHYWRFRQRELTRARWKAGLTACHSRPSQTRTRRNPT